MAEFSGGMICPVCKQNKLVYFTDQVNIPHFGSVLITTMRCPGCLFKQNNILILDAKEPSRYSVKVDGAPDLAIKVIRSSSGAIRIPEFGISMEPGTVAQGFISNIEGILHRFKDAIEMAKRWSEESSKTRRATLLANIIDEAIEGKRTFTLIVEDPLGNSAIVAEDPSRVVVEKLSKHEVEKLKEELNIS
ncbi:MAG: ZPR1 zinc finger domain-containing protein [Candidatus Hodarchaeota archaeon]